MSDRDMKALPDELTLSDGRRLNVLVRGRMSVCNRCQTQKHVKNCPRVEQPCIPTKAASEEGMAAGEDVATGSTEKVETTEMETAKEKPLAVSSESALPRAKRKRKKIVPERLVEEAKLHAVSCIKDSKAERDIFFLENITKVEPDSGRPHFGFVVIDKMRQQLYERFPTEISVLEQRFKYELCPRRQNGKTERQYKVMKNVFKTLVD